MKVITREVLAREAPDKFGWGDVRPLAHLRMEERTPERVSALIAEHFKAEARGDSSVLSQTIAADGLHETRGWLTMPDCDECGKSSEWLIELGEQIELGYETNRVVVCLDCLRQAVELGYPT